MRNVLAAAMAAVAASLPAAANPSPEALANWGQWRGPLATGWAPGANPPVTWSEAADGAPATNLLWRAALPGPGASTPVVWSNRVIVTAAVETELPEPPPTEETHRRAASLESWQRRSTRLPGRPLAFTVLCHDALTGVPLWATAVTTAVPHQATHRDGTWASPSVATDGRRVFASFGSQGAYGLDMDGRVLWRRSLGRLDIRNQFGEGASPCLYGDTLVVPFDHQGASFVLALDAATGAERWRVDRDEFTSWSTPIVAPHDDGMQAIVSATRRIRSYALDSGRLLWECGGLPTNAIPTPVWSDGVAYFAGNYRGKAAALLALRVQSARGDVTGQAPVVAWTLDAHAPYVPSPLLHGGRVYVLRMNEPVLSCFDASGRPVYVERKIEGPDTLYASPAGAAGRLYLAGRNGAVAVVSAGDEGRVLAVNRLRDRFTASPAIAGDRLYLRGDNHLYCIAPR